MTGKHRYPMWHLISRLYGYSMKLFARRWRFKIALYLSYLATPFIKLTPAYRRQIQVKVDTAKEISLAMFLNAMTECKTFYDLDIVVRNQQRLYDALKSAKGVLLITTHGQLYPVLVRFLVDNGYYPKVINTAPVLYAAGTDISIDLLSPSINFLVKTRSYLLNGKLVCAMIDRPQAIQNRTIEVETKTGKIFISDALIRVAHRCSASIVFFQVYIKRKKVLLEFESHSDDFKSLAKSTSNFIDFLRSREKNVHG